MRDEIRRKKLTEMEVSRQPITDNVEDVTRRHTEAGHVTTDMTSLPVMMVKFQKNRKIAQNIRKTRKQNVKVIYEFFSLTFTVTLFCSHTALDALNWFQFVC